MPRFELVEKFPRRPHPTLLHVQQALADTLGRIVLSRDIEKPLISLRGPGFI